MKLLILTDQIYKAGGLERTLAHRLNYWSSHRPDMQITLATHENYGRKAFFTLPDSVHLIDFGANYNRGKRLSSSENLIRAFRHFMALRKLLSEIKPDVIVLCGFGFDFYFLPLLAGRARLVKENHSSRYVSESLRGISRLKYFVRFFFESCYAKLIYLSPEEASISGHHNISVIPNPLNGVGPRAASRENVVLAAGRLTHIKGFDRLIQAWATIAHKAPDWRLVIYGDDYGDYSRHLIAEIEQKGLQSSVCIMSSVTDLDRKMSQSKVFALASLTECFPMVVLEAMQCGLPVVAFDCPTGPRNIITHGVNGLLIPDGDINAYSEALLELIDSDTLRQRLAQAGQVESERYEVSKVMRQWDALFSELKTNA